MKKTYASVFRLTVLISCIVIVLFFVFSTVDTVTDYYLKSIPASGKAVYAEEQITMYSADGTRESVPLSQVGQWHENGWYDAPVVILYAHDGKTGIFYESQSEQLEKEGWYRSPVAQMTKDGETQIVYNSKIGELRSNGWDVTEYSLNLSELGNSLKSCIENKKGRYGIYIKNLNTGDCLVLNDGKYSSASIIKLFTMATLYSEINKGNLTMNDFVQTQLNAMITVSDNQCANNLVSVIGQGDCRKGFDAINEFSRSEGCVNTQHLSQFSIKGRYIAFGRNLASPYDCGILLEKIYNKTLVSREYSEKMLDLLKKQSLTYKIPALLPEGTLTANKTGETSNIQSDVAIVFSPKCDYIICVLTNDSPSGIDDIRHISKLTYDYFNM